MRYKIINGRDEVKAVPVDAQLLTFEETVAMDVLDSFPPGTDMQTLYKEVQMRAGDSYRAWRAKAEIHVLINRRRGIECSYIDFLDEEFRLESIADIVDIMRETDKELEKSDAKLKEVLRRAGIKKKS